MIHYFQQINRQTVVWFAVLLSIAGLLFSRFLISMGMIIIVANALLHPKLFDNLRAFVKSPTYVSIALVIVVVFLSGLYSSNLDYWLERLRIKLPFLILPIGFAFVKPFRDRRFFYLLLHIFLLLIFITSIGVIVNYVANLQEITEAYKLAKVIPTPINHIRYSLMIAFAIAIGLHSVIHKIYFYFKWEPLLLFAISVFLLGFLHLLAVRSGILAAYIVIFVYLMYLLVSRRQYLWGAILLILLFAIPITAYQSMPTLQNKIKYMFYDFQQFYYHSKVAGLSDSRRIYSLQLGLKAGMQQPLIGVGYGDIKDEVNRFYQQEYPKAAKDDSLIPHNQFVMFFAGTGFIGLAVFIWVICYIIFVEGRYKEPLFLSLNLIILSSFMTEATIEVQLGTAFYLLFFFYLLKQPAFATSS